MMDCINFVAIIWLADPSDAKPITVEDAAKDLENWITEDLAVPEELTPELYAKLWNEMTEGEKLDNLPWYLP